MSKTPEELTEEWRAGKLEKDRDYYVETMVSDVFIDFYGQLYDDSHGFVKRVLAPVPTYDEYKAMRAELAEHRHYCCCNENEVLRLKLAEMEELLNECLAHLSLGEIGTSVTPLNILLTRINAALGDMLKNPENFDTSDGNVKGDDR